ncbi:flagellar basal-body rod protein FlgF [Anaeromicropila herbilytica]|uniref:Flagellar basal body rod protein FlgG n=1 Tax=Anaeromicropila herbilytica TaxID=2785025 RepID=A0A7R7EIZ6_9FIRM|nr:flagellar basal-body rod protein FlgF [Anaeromicropila herbilytica]BCN29638.1 flagellar basal body rod protein FlgG [Anaeromicropila herbilytica]
MVKGLYSAYTGMLNEQKRLDVISNNLANATTVGYKQENVTNQSFDSVMTVKVRDESEYYNNRNIGKMTNGVKLGEVYSDYSQGSLRQTGNTYDLAISGKGFFKVAVTDANGNQTMKYTRDGSFKMTSEGYIVDTNGNRLQGESGDIQVPVDTSQVSITEDGSLYADGQYLDKVKLTDFENYDYLKKAGDNLYETVDGANEIDTTATIRQGYTEQSNVNVVKEMVQMITITRAYEANQKAIQSVDGMVDLAVNSVGKV